jgi:hypothetical protein
MVTYHPKYASIKKDNYFTLHGLFAVVGYGWQSFGADQLKWCNFTPNKDCDINIQFAMKYIWSMEHYLSYGETYGLTAGQYRTDRYANTLMVTEGIPRLVLMEYDQERDPGGKTIDRELLGSKSRTWTEVDYNKTFSVKAGYSYQFFLSIPIQFKYYFMNWKIGDYKDISFNIFTEDTSNIDVLDSTFDLEKNFNSNKKNIQAYDGSAYGSENMGATTVLRKTTTTGQGKVKINKVKF